MRIYSFRVSVPSGRFRGCHENCPTMVGRGQPRQSRRPGWPPELPLAPSTVQRNKPCAGRTDDANSGTPPREKERPVAAKLKVITSKNMYHRNQAGRSLVFRMNPAFSILFRLTAQSRAPRTMKTLFASYVSSNFQGLLPAQAENSEKTHRPIGLTNRLGASFSRTSRVPASPGRLALATAQTANRASRFSKVCREGS